MTRFLQILQMLLAVVFIILTLGFISVEMEWTDGTRFRYSGWKLKNKNIKWFLLCLFVVALAAILRVV